MKTKMRLVKNTKYLIWGLTIFLISLCIFKERSLELLSVIWIMLIFTLSVDIDTVIETKKKKIFSVWLDLDTIPKELITYINKLENLSTENKVITEDMERNSDCKKHLQQLAKILNDDELIVYLDKQRIKYFIKFFEEDIQLFEMELKLSKLNLQKEIISQL